MVDLFRRKFRSVEAASTINIVFFRITPTELQFIGGATAEGEEPQMLGIEYRRELVYSIFRDLPRAEVEAVAAQKGQVEVLRKEDGSERTVNTLGPGQFFGEMAILRDMPRVATVRALAPTTLLAMERGSFRSLVAQSLGVSQEFDQVIQERLDQLRAGEAS